jgi:hypothetical protein
VISNGSGPTNKRFGLLKKEWTIHFTANFFGTVSDLWLPVAMDLLGHNTSVERG